MTHDRSQPGSATVNPHRSRRYGRRLLVGVIAAVALILIASCGATSTTISVLPAGDAGRGADLFLATCAACHGADGLGTDMGPPLVDPTYRPGHHSDAAFLLAVRRGVQPHHWSFGSMPQIPDVSDQDIADIVAHVRGLQTAAGIR